jgi:hypothetical protein
LRVDSLNSIVRAVTVIDTQIGGFNANQQQSLMRVVKNLSDSQSRRLASMSGGTELADLIECATGKNIQNLVSNLGQAVSPTANFATIWNNSVENNDNRLSGLVYNVLQGFSGAGGIEFGGYDYHGQLDANNGITTFQQRRDRQNQQDFRVGQTIGRMLMSAQLLNKKMFIALLSDGAVSANAGDGDTAGNNYTAFTSDSGERGCLGFIAYDPTAAPSVSSQQIGAFSNDGTVDRSFTVTGADAENAAVAIFANWAQFSNNLTLFNRALPNNTRFGSAFLDQVLRFA